MSAYRTGQRPLRNHRDEEVAPQLTRKCRIKSLDDKDIITFMVPKAELSDLADRYVIIVTVPQEGEESDVVYIKQVRRVR